ncbi:MAG: lysoplasmalogenase [Leadbetterella sp.]|nr:lysoplasmalogenase [Leadbetterella sp.]
MRTRLFFVVILLLEIYGSIAWHRPLVLVTKPLLIPLLMLIARQEGVTDKAYFLALFFSFLGDVFLMFDGWFIPGLVSFLLAHVSYIFLFRNEYRFSFIAILLFVWVTSGFLVFLYPRIPGDLRIPVVIYCTVITLMGIYAASRNTPSKASYRYILAGAVLFIISDSLIAVNKFHTDIPKDALYIMSTYGAAQYLILEGWLRKDSL